MLFLLAFLLPQLLSETSFTELNAEKSGNPIFEGWYADPDVMVFDKRYYVYPTWSVAYIDQTFFDCFSSPDLVHWTKHPRIVTQETVKWAKFAMWAPCVVKRNGKYFFFFSTCGSKGDEDGGIAVAVSNRPEGPFVDYLGKPLIDVHMFGRRVLDQMVFEDGGKTYFYLNTQTNGYVLLLNNDFTGFLPFDDGSMVKETTPENFTEGSYMFKRGGKYYFTWSEGGYGDGSYSLGYAIADNPIGPFKRIGKWLETDNVVATGPGHHACLNIPGTDKWYVVYHRHPMGKSGDDRVVCIDVMTFAANGYINKVQMTNEGVDAVPL